MSFGLNKYVHGVQRTGSGAV